MSEYDNHCVCLDDLFLQIPAILDFLADFVSVSANRRLWSKVFESVLLACFCLVSKKWLQVLCGYQTKRDDLS